MVQEEISELLSEGKSWKDSLVNYRENFVQSQKNLLKIASGDLSKDKLSDLERFQNQFYIQLLNIHDVKRDIKKHIHNLTSEATVKTSEDLKADHENLKSSYEDLVASLNEVNKEFKVFAEAAAV